MSIIGIIITAGTIVASKTFDFMLSIGLIGKDLVAKKDFPSLVYAKDATRFAPARNIIEYITTYPIPIISLISDDMASPFPALNPVMKYITTMKIGAISELARDVIASVLLRIMDLKSLLTSDITIFSCLSVVLLDEL